MGTSKPRTLPPLSLALGMAIALGCQPQGAGIQSVPSIAPSASLTPSAAATPTPSPAPTSSGGQIRPIIQF